MSSERHRRKSRSSRLDLEGLNAFREGLGSPEILAIHQRLGHFDELMHQRRLPNTLIAFEAIQMTVSALQSGIDAIAIKEIWPDGWDEQTVEVPLRLLVALSNAWSVYRAAEGEKSLGQAFGLESSLAARRKTLTTLKILDTQLKYAKRVEVEYIASGLEGKGKTLEMVYDEIAEEFSSVEGEEVSPETVKKAHKAFGSQVREGLKLMGIIN